MHSGTPNSLRQTEDRGREIAKQIAALLNEAEALAPGSTNGQILLVGATVRRGLNGWEVRD